MSDPISGRRNNTRRSCIEKILFTTEKKPPGEGSSGKAAPHSSRGTSPNMIRLRKNKIKVKGESLQSTLR